MGKTLADLIVSPMSPMSYGCCNIPLGTEHQRFWLEGGRFQKFHKLCEVIETQGKFYDDQL